MHSPASASARVEARPGIGISAFRRFLPVVSTQMLARNLTVFEIFLSLFELYKFSTLLHRSTFVFSAFRVSSVFFTFSRLLYTHHDVFRKWHTGWLAGTRVAKCRQMHFCFATTGADPDVHEPRDNVRRNQRLNRPFQSSFLFSIFHFFVFLFLRAFGYDPQERFFSSAFPGRSGHRGPSRFFLADCSLRSFVRAGLGNMLFRRARWVVVTARV